MSSESISVPPASCSSLAPESLGVGVLYTPALSALLRSDLDLFDFIEVIPDMAQTDRGVGRTPRFTEVADWIDLLDWLAPRRPLVAHNIGLSVGSADLWDSQYVARLASWQDRYHFRWHSDHLSASQVVGHDGTAHSIGVALPVPYDHDVLRLVSERVVHVQAALGVPFLLENNVYYAEIPDQEMDEPEFLNRLVRNTGCGILLDVHNLYANARNHGFSALSFVERLDLSRVREIHIAGGNEFAGMYTDSHAGPCPEAVWQLLEAVVPRAPNLCAITFEFHDSYFPVLGDNGVRDQLQRARHVWNAAPVI